MAGELTAPRSERELLVLHVDIGGPDAGVDGISSAVGGLIGSICGLGLHSRWVRRPRRGSVLGGMRDAIRIPVDGTSGGVVHFHSVFRPAHILNAWRLRARGVSYCVSPHSGLAIPALKRQRIRKRLWIRGLEQSFLENAARVVCLTELEARDVRRIAPGATTVVIPNPVTSEHSGLRSCTGGPEGEAKDPASSRPYVVTLCRFDVRQKGLDRLVDLAHHTPEIDFLVCGAPDSNEPRALRRLLARAPGNVEFRAPVFAEDKMGILASAAAYVQTSRWEGLSVSVLEAMAAGTPCAVSKYVAQTLDDMDGKYVAVLSDKPEEAALNLRELVFDREPAVARAERARIHLNTVYSPESVGNRLGEMYSSVAGRTLGAVLRK